MGALAITSSKKSHPIVKMLAEQYQLRIQGLPLDEEGIVPEAFEAACRDDTPTLLYCAPTIHPPTTTTMSDERRQAIAAVANRYDVLIVEDESAAFLLPEPLLPISTYAPRRSVFIADVWMALSMGLRTTYVLVPEPLHRPMATAVAAAASVPDSFTCTSAWWMTSSMKNQSGLPSRPAKLAPSDWKASTMPMACSVARSPNGQVTRNLGRMTSTSLSSNRCFHRSSCDGERLSSIRVRPSTALGRNTSMDRSWPL